MNISEPILIYITGSPSPEIPIIFLDIDGVLHPDNAAQISAFNTPCGNRLFRWAPLLLGLLQKYPKVKIVISSAWRYCWNYEDLVGFFPEEIRPYIIGTTRPSEPRRWEAIQEYIHQFKLTKYAIIDDAAAEFPMGLPGYIWCKSKKGLTHTEAFEALDKRLELISK